MPLHWKLAPGAPEKVLRVGSLSPVRTWDPREVQDSVSALCLMQAFETPFAPPAEPGTPPVPLLFEHELETVRGGDRPVLAGRLRAGVVFSDGTPLTAEHVVASLLAVEGVGNHAAVRAEGEAVLFTLRRPHARFSLLLSNHFCSVVLPRQGRLLGTGPFQLAPDSTAGAVRLVRNPLHRRPVPLDEVHFLHCPPTGPTESSGLVEALQREAVDFAVDLSRDDLNRLERLAKWFQPGVSTACLFFNTERGVLRDRRVRLALALAIDRQRAARLSFQNALGFTASGLLPPIMESEFRDGIPFEPDRARGLLSSAGVPLPLRLDLLLPWAPRLYLPHPPAVTSLIVENLAAIGVEVSPRPSLDIVDFYERTCDPGYEMGLIGWVPNSLDPADYLEVVLASHSIPQVGRSQAVRSNFARWSDPQTDELLDRHRQSAGEQLRRDILRRVAEEVPLLPLMYGPSIAAHTQRLMGFDPMAIAYHDRFGEVDLQPRGRRAAGRAGEPAIAEAAERS